MVGGVVEHTLLMLQVRCSNPSHSENTTSLPRGQVAPRSIGGKPGSLRQKPKKGTVVEESESLFLAIRRKAKIPDISPDNYKPCFRSTHNTSLLAKARPAISRSESFYQEGYKQWFFFRFLDLYSSRFFRLTRPNFEANSAIFFV